MEDLVKERGCIKGKLTRIRTFLDNVPTTTPPVVLHDLEVRMDSLDILWSEFDIIQGKIDALTTDETQRQAQEVERAQFEDRFYATKAGLRGHAHPSSSNRDPRNQRSSSPLPPPAVIKLPHIDIPTFSGKLQDWTPYCDLFRRLVHQNPALGGAEKLIHLKNSLRDEPARLLQSIQVTDANYEEAWAILASRYQNTRQIVHAHLKKLFSQTTLHSESATALRKLLDTTTECVRSLSVLKRPTDTWDDILVFFIAERMDSDTRREWELSLTDDSLPFFKQLTEFLEQRCRALDAASSSIPKPIKQAQGQKKEQQQLSYNGTVAKCVLCPQNHSLFSCPQFRQLNVNERWKIVKQHSKCSNCLSSEHTHNKCPSKHTCFKCKQRHHTLLHFTEFKAPADPPAPVVNLQTNFGRNNKEHSQMLLSTALILIEDSSGIQQPCRALLDSGSQASLITEACCQRLKLRTKKTNVTINGMGSSSAGTSRKYVQINLHSRSQPVSIPVSALVFPKVTGQLPNEKISTSWPHLSHLNLADPAFDTPGAVDILLGGDVYQDLMLDGRISGPSGAPSAMNTVFGWILSGRVNSYKVDPAPILSLHTQLSVDDYLKRFWELEEVPHPSPMSLEEKACERHFSSTHQRNEEGRFVVQLPFREDVGPLGNSKENAIKVLLQLERRLQIDPARQEQYKEAMRTSIRLGHMVRIPKEKIHVPDAQAFYLPHHYVLKESSTTALRVVFNASMKTSSGVSLNDTLMVGPTIQPSILPILIRFRTHITAFTADIAKMYPQVAMAPEHWNYQRVLWREGPDHPIQEYWLVTVTFGTASAPYLATKCLQQLATDEKQFPKASTVLLRDFYVDDLISGDRQQTAPQLTANLIQLLEKGKFQLRKWSSNDEALLNSLPPELRETKVPLHLSEVDSVKALGLQWYPSSDVFSYTVIVPPLRPIVTKRTLLSDTSRIFDPLGLAAPTTIRMKLLFQQLWLLRLTWDEELPPEVTEAWNNLRDDLPTLQLFKVPRYLQCDTDGVTLELHGFSDASEKAYAACIYLRVAAPEGDVRVQLIAAKTKVAPIKKVSLPRLELCGAVLLSRLMTVVLESLSNLHISSVHGWTDSTVVLAWVCYSPTQLKTFVANRVSEIQDVLAPHQWHHVPGEENPADCASRGINPSELLHHPLWWTGPLWLQRSVIPSSSFQLPKNNLTVQKEERTQLSVLSAVTADLSLLTKFSSLTKLQRVTAYVLRFLSNVRVKKDERQTDYLTTFELNRALMLWVKIVQLSEFFSEISALQDKDEIYSKSRLRSLNPFLDDCGILRVGGRLQNTTLSNDQKFPILLPRKHLLTQLIVDQEHRSNLHAGPQLLLASLNRRFWILCGRDVVRRHVHRCIQCHRHRADNAKNIMGQLPLARTEPVRAFLKTGVDYAGPLLLKEYAGRSRRTHKCYVCVFICFVTHAIHLELVLDLTTDAFIAALRRFISRRGKCSDIFSDNGTNFVGANRELQELLTFTKSSRHQLEVSQATAQQGINWHFIPPSSPHFGGLWEAGVKSMKHHLRRVVGNQILTFDEMQTVLCQIEATLNSRPLCPLSSDPSDLAALTPGHFLTFEALNCAPDPDLTPLKLNQLSRWQLAQRLQQHFWKRWSSEYLLRLQQLPKWFQRKSQLSIGDVVLIKDDRLPPLKWMMGRVLEVHPGRDGHIRVVTLKTTDGIIKRPTIKLCPLPLDPTN